MGVLLFGTVALCPFVRGYEDYLLLWASVWSAQVCLPAIWAALAEQPLSMRLPRVVGLVAVLMITTAWAVSRGQEGDTYLLALPVPVIGLVIFAPLLLVRWLFGWRIALPEEHCSVDQRAMQFSLLQLLAWIGSTAVLLAWSKCVLPDGMTLEGACNAEFMSQVLLGAAIEAVLGLPILIPSVGLVLARKNRGWFALGFLIAMSLHTAIFFYFMASYTLVAAVEGGFLSVLLGTLLVLRLCGYRLLRRKEERLVMASPACDISPPAAEGPRVWQTPFPYLVATILAVGLLVCWPASKLEAVRREAIAEKELARPWKAVGAYPTFEAGNVRFISFEARSPVSKAGLKKLQELRSTPNLALYFRGTKLSDDQMSYLCGLAALESLDLADTSITDTGLARLSGLDKLQDLYLDGTRVTDAGLQHLQQFATLKRLSLNGTSITGAGLAQLKGLQKLKILALTNTRITDADLRQLQPIEGLEHLDLTATQITGEGLVHFGGLPKLLHLILGSNQVTDANLKHLRQLKSLKTLMLVGTPITDAGLIHLTGLTNLSELAVGRKITDEGLKHLAKLSNLERLGLEGNPITDAGLVHLAGLKKLTMLNLIGTQITDAGVKHLVQLENLETLWLAGTNATDAGLVHLRSMKKLRMLDPNSTPITQAGLEEFRQARPDCEIESRMMATAPAPE